MTFGAKVLSFGSTFCCYNAVLKIINIIYFWLRFGFANAINDLYRLKICVVCAGKIFIMNVYNRFLSTKSQFNLCSSAVNSQRSLCSQKSWCEMFVLYSGLWYTNFKDNECFFFLNSNKTQLYLSVYLSIYSLPGLLESYCWLSAAFSQTAPSWFP